MKKITPIILLLSCLISCKDEPKHVQAAHRLMNRFTSHMQNSEHFHLSGSGGAMMGDIQQVSLTYESQRDVDINEARRLFVTNSERLLNLINTDTVIRPYLHDYPFEVKNLDFSLSFYSKSHKCIQNEFISYVFFARGNICYCNYDMEKKSQIVFREPYEEALKIVNNSKKLCQ